VAVSIVVSKVGPLDVYEGARNDPRYTAYDVIRDIYAAINHELTQKTVYMAPLSVSNRRTRPTRVPEAFKFLTLLGLRKACTSVR